MATCWHCYADVPSNAEACPVCGAPKPARSRNWSGWTVAIAVSLLALAVATMVAG